MNESPKDRLDELLLQRLRDLPAPPPSAGFADRVFPRQHPARAKAWTGVAIAASLVTAVALSVLLPHAPPVSTPAQRTIAVQRDQVQPVRLVFNSPNALAQVTLHVALPDGVELAGFPGERELSWQTSLKQGSNVLELPVLVHGGGGTLIASVTSGAERRQFAVELRTVSGETRSSLEVLQHA